MKHIPADLSVPVKSARSFRPLKDAWAHNEPPGRLMLTVLGGLADFERDPIRARTGEGRKRAQERGVKYGRSWRRSTDSHLSRRAYGVTA